MEYRGYDISYNFYGKGEYTVQYLGDDIVFKTKQEAIEYIDKLSEDLATEEDSYSKALEMLQDDELFTKVYESLDRELYCYPMEEIDNYYNSIRDFCNDITEDFNINDDYFYYSLYGLESTDYPVEVYRDDMDEYELLDRFKDYVMKHRDSIYYEYDEDFTDFMELIDNLIPQDEDVE